MSNSSSINTGALLRAGGIGLAAAFLLQVINAVVSVISSSASSNISSSNAGTMATVFSGLAMCICCLTALFFGGIGAAYSWFAAKSDSALDAGPMALGGAIAAYVDAILMGVCGVGVNYLTNIFNLASQTGNPAFGIALGGTLGLGGAGIGLIFAVCVYPIIFAVLGAAGAAIYATVVSNRSKPQPAAM